MNPGLSLYRIAFVVGSVAVLAMLFVACDGKKDAPPPITETEKVIVDSVPSPDGNIIYYEVRGEGDPALVFVHGWSCDRSYWKEQVEPFEKSNKLILIDLAGHGQSGQKRDIWSMASFGDDVAAVVNRLGLTNIVLIGHSMGGSIIIEAARRLPGKVLGLIAVDTHQNLGKRLTDQQKEAFLGPLREDFVKGTDAFVRSLFRSSLDSTLMDEVVADMILTPPEIGIGVLEQFFEYYFSEQIEIALKEVNLPVICINTGNFSADVATGSKLAKSFDVKVMINVGHFLMRESPYLFNKLLGEAITELAPPKT